MTIGTISLTDVVVPIVYILAVVALAVGFLLLRNLIFHRQPSVRQIAAASQHFEKRLLTPDFDGLEKHFGHALPQLIKVHYQNCDEVVKGDFEVVGGTAGKEQEVWYIAYYQPADLDNIRDAWPDAKEVFEFANDGCGNGYTIDPRLDDPPVMFFDHETGEWNMVASSFSEFIGMARRQPKE